MRHAISLIDLRRPPEVGDRVEVDDEGVFGGAPCTGHVIVSDGKWIVLMRGDTDECRAFGYYALKADHRWKKNGETWWRLFRSGMSDI